VSTSDAYARIYAAVRKIPRGRVASYGQIATLAGLPGRARQVGYALHALQDGRVPWHRVVNAQGCISARADEPGGSLLQRMRLEQEGVEFDARGRIPLDRFRWERRLPNG
jgi:methylated-DNA-protein-cysteine methyltransferase-like protein